MLNRIVRTLIIFFISNILILSMVSKAVSLESSLDPTCFMDSKIQEKYSKELAQLVLADQKEREHFDTMSKDQINQLRINDLIRRKRVGEIMGEGCIKTKADYAAASLIYQHGDVPDHYYQAFIWANKAVRLGDLKQKKLMAMTMDRYLVSIGKKQLFASQFQATDTKGWCYCLQPVERSFPDSYRVNYFEKKLSEQFKFLRILNKGKKNCHSRECPMKLSPTRRGSIPGFW